jgi:hypothetical protein
VIKHPIPGNYRVWIGSARERFVAEPVMGEVPFQLLSAPLPQEISLQVLAD